MPDSLFTDNATRAARLALDGLSQRQQVIARNIANIDTPGYRAQGLDFETALKSVFERSKSMALTTTRAGHLSTSSAAKPLAPMLTNRPGGSLRADENNVDIDVELTEMSETGIVYQAVSQSVSKKLQLLKTIANAR